MPRKGEDDVWCMVMFDLPVKTKAQRREATRFRSQLADLGFGMVQLSVYAQYLPLASRLSALVKAIKANLPAGGDVRILSIRDQQWAGAIRFSNTEPTTPEDKPEQLTIF